MSEGKKCSNCGAVIPAEAPAGQCIKCLIGYAIETGDTPAPNLIPPTGVGSTAFAAGEWPGERIGQSQPQKGFGDFEFLTEGKEGGMGVVYRVRQISLNRIVGLKMIRAGNFASGREVERFRTEAEAAARLDHPHIVPIYEVGEHEGRHYFTMKWVEGHNLAEALGETRLPGMTSAAATLMVKVAHAIQHAHERGILHRDLKPANILIDRQGEPHITDFGLAKLLENRSAMTVSGEVMGTPSYMSPEQAQGRNRQLTTGSDIFSLGAIMYKLLAGKTPFAGETTLEIIRRVVEQEPARPSTLNPAIDRDLETICLRCLQKDPQRRYLSAGSLASDLQNWLGGKPIAARPVNDWERGWKWVRRHPGISSLSAAVVLSILLGLAGVIWQWRRTNDANIRLQSQRADNFLAAEKAHLALDTLAQIVKKDPRNRTAAEHLINILNQRVFLVPRPKGASSGEPPSTGSTTDCLSRDGKFRVSRDREDAQSFLILEVATSNRVVFVTNAHSGPIRSLQFSPDARRVISSSADATARVWNAQDGSLIRTITNDHAVTWAEFSPDGSTIVVATKAPRAAARLWDANTGRPSLADPMRHDGTVNRAHFSADGALVVTASDDFTARLWYSETGLAYSEPIRLSQAVEDARFGSNGSDVILTPEDGKMRIYRPTDGIQFFQAADAEKPSPSAKDARTQALGSFAKQLKYAGEITCLDICTQSGILATASRDKSARLWNVKTLQPIGVPLIHDAIVNCVRFSPDGLRLVTSTAGPVTQVRIWDVQTGQALSDPISSEEAVAAVDFSGDGCWIISNAGWKWRLYPISGRAPAWLSQLGWAIADMPNRQGTAGTLNGLAETDREEMFVNVQDSLGRSRDSEALVAWAKEFLRVNW